MEQIMNQTDVKVSFYLKKSEADAKGNCPVMARLIVGKYSETAFSVKLRVPQSLWLSGRACGKSAAARDINNRLDEIRAAAFSIYAEQSANREVVTAEEVKHQLLGMASEQETLLSYFRLFMRNFEKRVGINRTESSLNGYRNSYDHLVRFLQSQYKLSDIPFAALDRSFIEKFDLHLRTECHLAPGTIVNLTVRLKTIVGEAIADGIITAFPFVGYEPTHPQSEQKYLTTEELNRIMTTPLHSRTLYHVRDLFLFSCYTGIPYSDMCMLTNENLSLAEDGIWWIRSSRKKTGVDFEIPLMELPLHIIEKYRDVAPEGKLLPMYSNSSLNHYLKQIAVLCGIERKLVFHLSRHSFATTVYLCNGGTIEALSKILGHKHISTTQIYAVVTNKMVSSDFRAISGNLASMQKNVLDKKEKKAGKQPQTTALRETA